MRVYFMSESKKIEVDEKSVEVPLPKEIDGRITNGTYYFLGNMEGIKDDLFFIAEVKDHLIVCTHALDAKRIWVYLNANKAKFEGKAPMGCV